MIASGTTLGLAFALVPQPSALAATTLTSSCTDGGGHLWQGKAVWEDIYTDPSGIKRARVHSVGFTTAAADATTVDYSVDTYDGNGTQLESLHAQDLVYDFAGGTRGLISNPVNPPTAPGKAKVVVSVGDGNDGFTNCTMTFVQPVTTPTTTPPPATPTVGTPTSPQKVCGQSLLLNGPSAAPAGAVVVPAGDNSRIDFTQANTTFWFAAGTHTLGSGEYDQVVPADNSTYIGAPGAVIDGQGKNNYAFTQHASGVTIKYLTIKNFVAPLDEGTVNHDSGANWTMQYNTIENNGGAGVFLGSGNIASHNCLKGNSQYGFQAYGAIGGERNIVLEHNEIVGNNTGNWEAKRPGCGCTGGGKFWDVRDVKVTDNYVHDNLSVAFWADTNNNNFLFQSNWIENNAGQAILWEISYNVAIRNNVIKHNLTTVGPERMRSGDNFPDAAIYISESGGDSRLPFGLVGTPTVDISSNLIVDNYNGVSLWENADRYCGSPANTSTDYCTIVNPSVAKVSTCNSTNIAKEPYYSDCRWKTQNVLVHHNIFRMDRANFGNCSSSFCGRNAIFSNWGSYPSWSPYQEDKVARAIVFAQGNRFSNNTYIGSWNFTALDTGNLLTGGAWKVAPYNQDAGSTFEG